MNTDVKVPGMANDVKLQANFAGSEKQYTSTSPDVWEVKCKKSQDMKII